MRKSIGLAARLHLDESWSVVGGECDANCRSAVGAGVAVSVDVKHACEARGRQKRMRSANRIRARLGAFVAESSAGRVQQHRTTGHRMVHGVQQVRDRGIAHAPRPMSESAESVPGAAEELAADAMARPVLCRIRFDAGAALAYRALMVA